MLIERLLARFYEVEAGDTSAGGGGADTVAAAAGADTVAGAKGTDTAPGGKGGDTLLAQLGAGGGQDTAPAASGADTAAGGDAADKLTPEARALAAAEKDTRRPKHVPSKYWDTEKGEVKLEAWGKSTQQLEARMRDVGLPPDAADGYKFEVPKPLKDAGVDLDPAMGKAFREKAHALGLTQKQYEGVMGQYFESMGAMAEQTSAFSSDKAKTELLGFYKTEDALRSNVQLAYKAFSAYADEKDMALIDQIGNIPAVIRVLAKVGAEMKEDPGVHPDAILDTESLETLMRGKPGDADAPYWNEKDARHKSTVAKVMRHHEATAAAQRRKAA
jgi:hypothetical protein